LAKRGIDIVGALIGLAIAIPLVAIAAVAIKLDSPGPIFFGQVRIGENGRTFRMFKLRSMVDDAEHRLAALIDLQQLAQEPAFKLADDPRVTRVGRILRRTSLDELPQFYNVLRGEMSLVGPRPDVPGFADALTGADRIVLSVRPGITGPAALAFRHEESLLASVADPETYNREVIWPEKVRINREYVQNWSLAGDLRCLLGTVSSVLEPSPSVGGTPRE
jgi:lipopolysaccharide/colanic/teichoic acid biosynthesis glycosyltransferase